jgi:DNA primase catalytic core
MIPRNLLDNIRVQTDIVDLISQWVTLKAKGSTEYQAICPFLDHTEQAPSFSVSRTKQIYKCFGCGRGGNVFTFLMDYQRMTFGQAAAYLANRLGIKLEYKADDQADQLLAVHDLAGQYFVERLADAEDYFVGRRGLSPEIVAEYRLGYDDGLLRRRLSDWSPELIALSGLLIKGDRGYFDRWASRWVFPLIDLQGRTLGFAGTAPGATPKYMNSPDTPIYDKGAYLYGLDRAWRSISKCKGVIIVEGYFDQLSMYQAGYTNTVAICGVALTPKHAKLLARYCAEAVLALDSDSAGVAAVDSSMAALFDQGISVYVVKTEDKDPDLVIREHGRPEMTRLLRGAQSWFDMRLRAATPDHKAQLTLLVKKLAGQMVNVDRRSLFLDLCAEQLKIVRASLTAVGGRPLGQPERLSAVDYAQALILLAGVYADQGMTVDERLLDDHPDLLAVYRSIRESGTDSAALYTGLTGGQARLMDSVIYMAGYGVDTSLAMKSLIEERRQRRLHDLVNSIRECEGSGGDPAALISELNQLIGAEYAH